MKFLHPQAVTLPLSLSDGKWHHVCVTWTTRDGLWEAYQDGVQKGTGTNLSPWHAIKPGGVFILGQEQVKIKKKKEHKLLDVQLGLILTSDQILTKFMSRLFRTLWGVVLMPPSRTWGRCPSCTCGPAS